MQEFFTTATIMTSCLGNDLDDIKLGSESSITAFSIGTVWVPVTGVDQNGNDSVYLDSIDCSGYPFTIDQLNRRIENKDSLPVGADVSRVFDFSDLLTLAGIPNVRMRVSKMIRCGPVRIPSYLLSGNLQGLCVQRSSGNSLYRSCQCA